MTAFSKPVVALIWIRDQGRCSECGEHITGERGVDWSVHHREPRGMGGTKADYVGQAANGTLLHGSGTTGCHGLIEKNRTKAKSRGFLINRNGKHRPVDVPLLHALFGWVLLDNLGGLEPTKKRPETL